jgi:hypothetical protein
MFRSDQPRQCGPYKQSNNNPRNVLHDGYTTLDQARWPLHRFLLNL